MTSCKDFLFPVHRIHLLLLVVVLVLLLLVQNVSTIGVYLVFLETFFKFCFLCVPRQKAKGQMFLQKVTMTRKYSS